MSSVGDKFAAVGEFGLWVAAAAIIGGALGMRLPVDLTIASAPTPSPVAAAPTAASSPTLAPTPSAAPTLSPLVAKFQAYLARKDFQFQATGTGSQSATGANLSIDFTVSGSVSYKAGDESDTQKMTAKGAASEDDTVYSGSFTYERINAGPWIKKPRTASDSADMKIFLSPTRLFVDTGVETKNGSALHRLQVADPAALGAAVDAIGTVTDAHVSLVFWTKADGTPVVFRMDGTWTQSIGGVQAAVTTSEEFVLTKLSGVTITAPKSPWQWIVDGTAGIGFGLPSDWAPIGSNQALGLTTYANASGQVGYKTYDATGLTLGPLVDQVIAAVGDPVQGRQATTLGGQPAIRFGVHRSKQKDYEVETLAIYEGQVYQFLFFGVAGKDAATDAMAAQILSTLQFTK